MPKKQKTKQIEDSPYLYKKDDIVAIFHEKYNKYFTLLRLTENVETKEEKLKGILAIRGSKPNAFYLTDEAEFEQKDILGYIETAQYRELKSPFTVTDIEGKSFDSNQRVRISLEMHKKLESLAEKIANPEESEVEETEEEEEEIENEVETQAVETKKSKKIIGGKKKSKEGARKSKRTKKIDENEDNEEEGGKKMKRSKSKKGKVEKYKKGKYNPFVKIREEMAQYEDKSEDPVLDRSVINNNRELIRAVNIGSIDLYKRIVYESNEKISRLSEKWGVDNETTPFKLAIMKDDVEMLTVILESMDPDYKDNNLKQFTKDPTPHINKIDTGFNDKYAYGVVTRAVNMARGNREGNNAFLRDNYKLGNSVTYQDCFWLMKNNSAKLEHLKLVISFFPNLRHNFLSATIEAVLAGNCEKAAYFIEENLERDTSTFNKYHRLALISKSKTPLEGIPKRSVTKQAVNAGNYCPIHCACINPNIEVLKYLMEVNPEFNVKDEQGRKPVHYAACCESEEPIKFLIDNNVDTRDIDLQKKTPLMYAAEAGRAEVIKVLMGPNRSNIEGKDKKSFAALHYAALNGHINAVKELLIGGADINKGGPHRKTALHLAAQNGDVEMVEFLIEKGARRTSRDKFKRTALILAVMNGNLKVASILLKHGAPFDTPDSSDNFPLHYACAYGYPEMIDLLIEAGCDPNTSNSWRLNAVTVGLLKNYFECVKKMLDYPQTDVDCIDNDGRSLLSNTVKTITEQSFEHFIFLLEEKKANPNSVDRYGLSSLHHLCRITVDKVYEMNYSGLAIYGSEKKQKMKECKKLYRKFINSLLDHGGDINLKNEDGIPPIFLALMNRNVEAIEVLLERPDLKLNLLTKKNESIFHYLTDIVDSEKFVEVLEKILSMVENVRSILNKVADSGYNAVHHIVEKYVMSHSSKLALYKSQLLMEAREAKREDIQGVEEREILEFRGKRAKRVKKRSRSRRANISRKFGIEEEDFEEEEEKFNGLKGGARTKKMRYYKEKKIAHYGGGAVHYHNPNMNSINYQNTNNYSTNNYSLTLE